MSFYGSKQLNRQINALGYNAPPPKAVRDIVKAGGRSGVTSSSSKPSYQQTASGQAVAQAKKTNVSSSNIVYRPTLNNKALQPIRVNQTNYNQSYQRPKTAYVKPKPIYRPPTRQTIKPQYISPPTTFNQVVADADTEAEADNTLLYVGGAVAVGLVLMLTLKKR